MIRGDDHKCGRGGCGREIGLIKSMLRFIRVSGLLLLLIANSSVKAYEIDLEAVSDSINSVTLDYSQQLEVKDLVIEKGGVKFLLDSGTLTLSSPVFGRVLGAAFVGNGRFLMVPPTPPRNNMLTKLCKDSIAAWEFKELAIFATDDLFVTLKAKQDISSLNRIGGEKQLLSDFTEYTQDEFEVSLASQILPELLQPNLPGSFRAKFKGSCGNMVFVFDPKEVEEISLYKQTTTTYDAFPELVSSFHSPEQYASSQWGPDHENKDLADSLVYDIDGKIWQSAKTDLTIKLSFISSAENLQSIHFSLFPDMMLETIQVKDGAGDSLYLAEAQEGSRNYCLS